MVDKIMEAEEAPQIRISRQTLEIAHAAVAALPCKNAGNAAVLQRVLAELEAAFQGSNNGN